MDCGHSRLKTKAEQKTIVTRNTHTHTPTVIVTTSRIIPSSHLALQTPPLGFLFFLGPIHPHGHRFRFSSLTSAPSRRSCQLSDSLVLQHHPIASPNRRSPAGCITAGIPLPDAPLPARLLILHFGGIATAHRSVISAQPAGYIDHLSVELAASLLGPRRRCSFCSCSLCPSDRRDRFGLVRSGPVSSGALVLGLVSSCITPPRPVGCLSSTVVIRQSRSPAILVTLPSSPSPARSLLK